ncbi:MAG: phosphotransferase family protein [Paracoccaceae bacterium]
MSAADFDPAALERFLGQTFGASPQPMQLSRIAGGQSNPTYFVTFGGRNMVLRKKPAGPILKGAHAIDREYRVLRALEGADVPVPRAILYHEDGDVLGTPFYLMERLEGRVFHDCALEDVPTGDRRGLYMGMADAMAKLHAVVPADVGLGDYGPPGNYFERQIRRWTKQYHASTGGPIAALDALVDWLPDNMPANDGRVSIAHGDFRLGNMLFHPSEPRVVGILDWELSTLGHPLADLGFCCMSWHSSPEEYGGILGLDLAARGLLTQQEFIDRYYASAAPTAPLTDFHIAFALFRFSVIFVGIADRARAGSAASDEAARLAPLAERFAIRATEVIAGEHAT